MKRIFLGVLLGVLMLALPHHSHAQGVTRICLQSIGGNGSNNCVDTSATNPFPIGQYAIVTATCGTAALTAGQLSQTYIDTSGKFCTNASGGSSGLSVVDQAPFTAGTSPFTPSGCQFNSTPQTLTSGLSGMFACSSTRHLLVLDDNSASLLAAAQAGTGLTAATTPTSAILNGVTDGTNLRGMSGDTAGHVNTNGAFNVTPTDCSVTLTTGGTAQNAIAATATLHGFTIANVDTGHNAEPVWFSFTGTAVAGAAGSYPLAVPTATSYANLSSYTTPPGFGTNHAVSVIAATTSHIISCTWW